MDSDWPPPPAPATPGITPSSSMLAPGLRVRLVWEGQERVLWVESASEVSAQIISRWYDVEWSLAGQRLPLDTDTSDERIERLAGALDRFLATRET